MLTGLTIGILAAFLWSITNLVDKYLVDKYSADGNIGGVLLLSCFYPTLLLLTVFFVVREKVMYVDSVEVLVLLLSGALMVSWIFFYLKALSEDDPSVVMTIMVLAPLFSLFFGQLILQELPSPAQMFAAIFMLLGALTVVYEPRTAHFKWNLFGYAIAACMITGLMTSLFKFVAIKAGVWESLFWRSSGMVLVGGLIFLLSINYRKAFYTFISKHFVKGVGLNLTNETLTLVGDTLFSFAILFAPLALVSTTEAYQPVFIFIMIFVLNRFGITILTEHNSREVLIQKGIGFFLVLIGTGLLSMAK